MSKRKNKKQRKGRTNSRRNGRPLSTEPLEARRMLTLGLDWVNLAPVNGLVSSGPNNDWGEAIVADGSGIYSTAWSDASANGNSLTVSKHDDQGNLQWTHPIHRNNQVLRPGNTNRYAGKTVDVSGNRVFTAFSTGVTNSAPNAYILHAFDSNGGAPAGALALGGSVFVNAIAAGDTVGNQVDVFVAGWEDQGFHRNAFVAKLTYSTTLNQFSLSWTRHFDGTQLSGPNSSNEEFTSLDIYYPVAGVPRIIATGNTDGEILGSPTPGTGASDAFAMELDGATGAGVWVQQWGSGQDDYSWDVAIDANQNLVHFVGGTTDTLTGLPPTISPGFFDAWIMSLDATSGSQVNAAQFSSNTGGSFDEAYGITMNDAVAGNFFVTGWSVGDLPGNPTNGDGLWIAEFDPTLSPLYFETLDGNFDDWASDVTAHNGMAYVTGSTNGSLNTLPVASPPPANQGGVDAFIGKFGQPTANLQPFQTCQAPLDLGPGLHVNPALFQALVIDGTRSNFQSGDKIDVGRDNNDEVWVRVNNSTITRVATRSEMSGVSQIRVIGKSGKETITIDDSASWLLNPAGVGVSDPNSPVTQRSVVIYGSHGNDNIYGGQTGECIYGGPGVDTIQGQWGSDYIRGGTGNDDINGEFPGAPNPTLSVNDEIWGDDGDDTIQGSWGNDIIRGGGGVDTLRGWTGDDHIHGGVGDDIIYGQHHTDRLWGNSGVDKIWGQGAGDFIWGGTGDDKLRGDNRHAPAPDAGTYGQPGGDCIFGEAGMDDAYGHEGNDEIHGGAGMDDLYGNQGNDDLFGNTSPSNPNGDRDWFHGGPGNDASDFDANDKANIAVESNSPGPAVCLQPKLPTIAADITTFSVEDVDFSGLEGPLVGDEFAPAHGIQLSNMNPPGVLPEGGAVIENLDGFDDGQYPDGAPVLASFPNDVDPFTITFDEPIAAFGAFVGSGNEGTVNTLTVNVFDADDTLLHTFEVELTEGMDADNLEGFAGIELHESTISKVTILNDNPVGVGSALIVGPMVYGRNPDPNLDFDPSMDLNEDGAFDDADLALLGQQVAAGQADQALFEAWDDILNGVEPVSVRSIQNTGLSFTEMAQVFGNVVNAPEANWIDFTGLSGVIPSDQFAASHGVTFRNLAGIGAANEGDPNSVETLDGFDGSFAPDGATVYVSYPNHVNPLMIDFASPISAFGAFVGSGKEGSIDTLTVEALDADGNVVYSELVQLSLNDDPQNREGFIEFRLEDIEFTTVSIRNNNDTDFGNALILFEPEWDWGKIPPGNQPPRFVQDASAFEAFFINQPDEPTELQPEDAEVMDDGDGNTIVIWPNDGVSVESVHSGSDCDDLDPNDELYEIRLCSAHLVVEGDAFAGNLDGYHGSYDEDGAVLARGRVLTDPNDPDSDADGISIRFDTPVSTVGSVLALSDPPDVGHKGWIPIIMLTRGFDSDGNVVVENQVSAQSYLDFDNDESFWTLESGSANISSVLLQVVDANGNAIETGYEWKLDNLTFTAPDTSLACDFNADGACDGEDIDDLVGAILNGSSDPLYDMNGDGTVNLFDLQQWRADAGAINLGPGRVYQLGDGNLDGIVDVSDFNLWNSHKFTGGRWTEGDWNADGIVDVSDFNLWNAHKFTSADQASTRPITKPKSTFVSSFTSLKQQADEKEARATLADLVFANEHSPI